MNDKLANPSAFAFGAFACALWMYSMISAGWFSAANHGWAIVAGFTLAGTGLVFAGIMEFFRGDTFQMVLFLFLGMAGWGYAMSAQWSFGKMASGYAGFGFLMGTVIFFILWLASFSIKKTMLQFFLLGLWISFVLWTIGAWGIHFLNIIGGYVGLATAILAFIIFFMEIFFTLTGETKKAGAVEGV